MAKFVTARRMAIAAGVLVAVLPIGTITPAFADTSPGPPVVGYGNNRINCAPEQFPHGGAPRNSSSVPYQIPFTATLGPDPTPSYAANGSYAGTSEGGYFAIEGSNSLIPGVEVTVVLGASATGGPTPGTDNPGQLYATGCGIVNIPSLHGGIGPASSSDYGQPANVNPNFVFAPSAPIGLGLSPAGIVLPSQALVGTTTADGFLSSSISPNPAANGGLNVTFSGSFRSTTNFTGLFTELQGLLPTTLAGLPASIAKLLNSVVSAGGNTCTIAIGNLATDGLSAADIASTGLTATQASEPVTFTTQKSGTMQGKPVTGPIAPTATGHSQDQAALVSNDFPVGKITTGTPDTSGQTNCSAGSASLLNSLLGLPSKAGHNFFYAPATFGVYTSS